MTEDSLMRRLRSARPVTGEPGPHDALFAQIIAGPGDPRLVRPARRWTRARSRILAGSTLGLAGVGAAVVLAVGGPAAPAAFAITKSGDGSVLVKINRLQSLPEANRKLAAMGIGEQVTLYMAPGAPAVKGPVDCRPAAGARLSGPPLKVLVGRDGTDRIGPGRSAGVIGVSTYHLDHCVITGVSGSGVHTAATAAQRRTVQVWMAVHQRAAQRFVSAASTPGSPSYRRFLSPGAYTRRFGPSAAQVKAVRSFLTGQGFTRVRASVNDVYVSATAPASIGSKLTLPSSIRRDVLAVTGLSGTTQARADGTATTPTTGRASAKAAPCSRYWAQKTKTVSPAFRGLTKAAVPVCGYSARQIRAAYGLTPARTGRGKTIALIQVGGPDDMFKALTDFARANGLPAPRSGQYREEAIGQGAKNRKCVNGALEEAALDSETAYAIAPGARQLMVDGDDCETSDDGAQALFDAMLAPLTGSRASAAIESVSYGLVDSGEAGTPPALLRISHSIALRAAAEGVSLLDASGDSPGVDPPASDPDITAVGGTTLGIGARNQRLFETGWSTAFGERTGTSGPWHDNGILLAAGGGVSAVYGQPAYQKGVVPGSMARDKAGHPGRTVPDISADADPYSGMLFGLVVTHPNGKTTPYEPFRQAGTSMATPLVAGMVADAEQGRAGNLGFLNPLLYSLAGRLVFHDIKPVRPSDPRVDRAFSTPGETDISNKFAPGFLVGVNDAQDARGTHQVTAPGYDTMTGLGTPNGAAFIDALRSALRPR